MSSAEIAVPYATFHFREIIVLTSKLSIQFTAQSDQSVNEICPCRTAAKTVNHCFVLVH